MGLVGIYNYLITQFQPAHLHAHRIKQHLSHLPFFLISGFGWKHAGESPFKAVSGHVFSITQVPGLAVTETIDIALWSQIRTGSPRTTPTTPLASKGLVQVLCYLEACE